MGCETMALVHGSRYEGSALEVISEGDECTGELPAPLRPAQKIAAKIINLYEDRRCDGYDAPAYAEIVALIESGVSEGAAPPATPTATNITAKDAKKYLDSLEALSALTAHLESASPQAPLAGWEINANREKLRNEWLLKSDNLDFLDWVIRQLILARGDPPKGE